MHAFETQLHDNDAQEIRSLVTRLCDAWNRNDADAYAALFTDASDYVAYDGTHLKGARRNAEHHRRLFDTVLKNTRLVFERIEMRRVTDDVVVMHGDGTVLMPWHVRTPDSRRSIQTYVVVRTPKGWRFTAFHNTRVRPIRMPTGLALAFILLAMRVRAFLARGARRGDMPPAPTEFG